ncbi:MAG: hydantoinase/carbamoylase family amidase, partial [Betaproteobacteria bacterium]|nr:hydantoinase/carbamoylase family amidase [Betaproteobacteria bacterium]
MALIEIKPRRYWSTVERSGEIGLGRPGGLARVALSEADREMRDQFVAWCREAGCSVSVDGVGNIFARRKGRDDSLPPVVVGSHLDTQVNGGRYDGIVGVLAGLEIVRSLNDGGIETKRPIEVVDWTNEEGARFSPPMIAAGAFAGVYAPDWVLDRQDDDGKRFGDELSRIGYAGREPVGGRPLDSYFELHIEQGPLLDAKGIDVGVVTHGYTAHGFIVEVKGETAHTGPWPMDKRRNALVGAAMLAVAAHDIGWRYHATQGKGTAARIVAWPNKPGILSDWAQFTGDLRHEDPAAANRMLAEFREAMADCARRANVD